MTITTGTVAQQGWERPSASERMTWAEAEELVRDGLGTHTYASLPSYAITQAIHNAVHFSYPKAFMIQLWQGVTEHYIDEIDLPWPAERSLMCSFRQTGEDSVVVMLGPSMVDIYGKSARLLFNECDWPFTGEVQFTIRVVCKPQPVTVSTVYCTLAPEHLIPLTECELWPHFAREDGMLQSAIVSQQRLNRQQTWLALPRHKLPPYQLTDSLQTVSTSIWHSWGQTDVTFEDLA